MTLSVRRIARPQLLIVVAIAVSVVASCGMADTNSIDFAFEGRVLDADTKQPIEGAYALAVYETVELGMAASARNCVKTKGMTTGRDGKFSFPIDRLDGNSPAGVYAIKPDYYFSHTARVSTEIWKKNNVQTYSNRDVYLRKQNPAKPEFQHGFSHCRRPESRQAAEAAITFLEIELKEERKYAPDRKNDSIEFFIQRLKDAPSR
jgi:hypothetical protein